MPSFPTWNTVSKLYNRLFMPSLSLELLLSIVIGSDAKIESREATYWTHCKQYGALPKVSIAPVPCSRQLCGQRWCWDSINIAWCSECWQMATCVAFWGLFVAFSLTSHRKMVSNINDAESNTLSVLHNINFLTDILLQHQHYITYILYVQYIYVFKIATCTVYMYMHNTVYHSIQYSIAVYTIQWVIL